jgi:glycolate oxidase iron-sulfur subunit
MKAIPGLKLIEMPLSDLCCGSAGIYNVTETELAMQLLRGKMEAVNSTGAEIIATANPGCILQLRAGVQRHGHGQEVLHVIELLDRASGSFPSPALSLQGSPGSRGGAGHPGTPAPTVGK